MQRQAFLFSDFFRVALFSVALAVAPASLLAQFRVDSVTPRQNEINVPGDATIQIGFRGNANPATLDGTTWLVHGNQTGFYQGAISFDVSTATAEFRPATGFKPGEAISVVLTREVLGRQGERLDAAFQSSFTVAVEFGTGIFDERVEISLNSDPDNPVERDPAAILAGDFDNDLYTDLVVANNSTNSVTVLMNRFFEVGETLQPESPVSVGNGPTALTGGDFDQDGLLDVAVSNFDESSISVLHNLGWGRLSVVQTIPTHEHPTQLEARDFDADGHMDLAVLVLGVNQLQIFLNNGDGSFNVGANTYATGASPYGLAPGDFDNDGDLDLVVTNSGDNSIIVYKNDGLASFSTSGEISVLDFPTTVRAGDFSGRSPDEYGDGFLDLILVHPNINAVSVYVNVTRDGGFVLQRELDAGLRPTDIFVGDVDTLDTFALSTGFGKDHDLDLVVPNLFSNDVHVWRNQFNNGFEHDDRDRYPAGETPVSIAGADFDRDGDIDVAVTNMTAHGISVLLNQGGVGGGLRFTQPSGIFDFGQVYVGTDSTRSFRLFNPTDQPAIISEISTTLPQFTAAISQATIAPGNLFSFELSFAPTDTVLYGDTLTVRGILEGVEQELKVALRGEGVIALISVVPDTLNFGGLVPPQIGTLPVQITNSGNGALIVSELRFSNSAFSAPVSGLTVQAHSSQQVDVVFQPATPFFYLDSLLIVNNDSLNTPVPVILVGGPNDFTPEITSADTVVAVEDSLFTYTATVSDSDGTQARFSFQNLPGWLHATSGLLTNTSVEGVPLEGGRDTTFTVVALDGFFSDTLQVYVRVLPVNDPPVFDPVNQYTTTESIFLSFNLSASDPEDSTLIFAALGLPAGAVLTENGDNTATFSWIPPAGSRGVYDLTVIATEALEPVPLSDTVLVRINVLAALPDLVAASLSVPTTDISVNQTHPVTGIVRADFAAVDLPFRMTFFHDGQIVRDTVVTQMAVGQELTFIYLAQFGRLGDHEIRFEVDTGTQIVEVDEGNNSAILRLQATKPQLLVRPNPFTPNSDGFNDEAVFDFGDLVVGEPRLKIFKFNGILLTTLNANLSSEFRWDGRDDSGRAQKPGLYLFVLSDNSEPVRSGYVVLAR